MRSVVVVFPASMCALMPMLRYRSMGVTLGICHSSNGRFDPLLVKFASSAICVGFDRLTFEHWAPSTNAREIRFKRFLPQVLEPEPHPRVLKPEMREGLVR